MKPALLVLLGICAGACAMSASATSAIYLETPGVTGPVDAPGLSGAFNVDAFDFATVHCGHVTCSSLDVLIPSAESAPLLLAVDTGKHFSLMYLIGFTYSSSTTDYLKYTLGDALITSISSGGGVRDDKIVFDFAKLNVSEGTCGHTVSCPPPRSVPEPATLALLSLGLFGLGLSRRKRAA